MTDTALVGGICVDIKKSMSRFANAYLLPNISQNDHSTPKVGSID
ncbi:hypothetical protein AB6D74_22350 [Vibrio cyclitrophicus]